MANFNWTEWLESDRVGDRIKYRHYIKRNGKTKEVKREGVIYKEDWNNNIHVKNPETGKPAGRTPSGYVSLQDVIEVIEQRDLFDESNGGGCID